MERIYNKLKRHSLDELKQILGSLNVEATKCKTKDDYIRLFIKRKAKTAKLIPKKSLKKVIRSDRSDHSKASQASVCIIEEMKNEDISRIDKYLDKHRKDKYVPEVYSILFSHKPQNSAKRERSNSKDSAQKRVKADERSVPKAKSKPKVASVPVAESKKVKKRAKKDTSKQRKSSKATGRKSGSVKSSPRRLVNRSVTSTPKRLEKISEASRSALENSSDKNRSIVSDIDDSAKERIEKEVLMTRSDPSKDSHQSIPDYIFRSPNTRSKTKEYVARRHNEELKNPLKIKFERAADDHSEEGRPRHYYNAIYTPIKNRIMTPIKRITANGYNKVTNSYIFKSETIGTILLLIMVAISLGLGTYNHISKKSMKNYEFEDGISVPYLTRVHNDNKHSTCVEGSIRVGYLCAPENNEGYIKELDQIQKDFDTILESYEPCRESQSSERRRVIDHASLLSISNNNFFKNRLSAHFEGDEGTENHYVTIGLNANFKATPSTWKSIKCGLVAKIVGMDMKDRAISLAVIAVSSIALYSLYFYLVKSKDTRTAKRLFKIIKDDMESRGMYRFGIDLNRVYSWYSTEFDYSRKDFTHKVLPWLQTYLNESSNFTTAVNRNGVQIWKLIE